MVKDVNNTLWLAKGGMVNRIAVIGVYSNPEKAIEAVIQSAKTDFDLNLVKPDTYDASYHRWEEEFFYYCIHRITVNEAIND